MPGPMRGYDLFTIHGGKISRAAEDLGISRPTFYELMEKLGLAKPGLEKKDS